MLKKASIVTFGLVVAVSPGAALAAEQESEYPVQQVEVQDQNSMQNQNEETTNSASEVVPVDSEAASVPEDGSEEGTEEVSSDDQVPAEDVNGEEIPEDEETVVENIDPTTDEEVPAESDNSEEVSGDTEDTDEDQDQPELTDLEILEVMKGSISGQVSSFDVEKGYYTLSVNVNVTNNSTQAIENIYAGLDIPEDIMILATDETPDGIEILDDEGVGNVLAVSLDKISAGETKNVSLDIPVIGKTTGEGLTNSVNIYRIDGTFDPIGPISGTSNLDYGSMNQAMYFDGKAQAVTDFPGLADNQFGMQFGFKLQNLTLENVDNVNIEFIVPKGVKIHEPDGYKEGDTPDALDDFLGGGDLGLGTTSLDLDWNGNTATVDIGAVESGTMFQGFFSAIGESAQSLNAIKELKVKITLTSGDVVVEEITTPIELVKYEGNDNEENDETSGDTNDKPGNDNSGSDIDNDKNNDNVNQGQDNNEDKITVKPVSDKKDNDEIQGGKLPKTAGTDPVGALMGGAIAAFGAFILAVRKRLTNYTNFK